MKFNLSYLALLVVLPGLVCAGTYKSFAKEVSFVEAYETERYVAQRMHSYDLIWSDKTGKFEANVVTSGKPLIIEQLENNPKQAPEANIKALAI